MGKDRICSSLSTMVLKTLENGLDLMKNVQMINLTKLIGIENTSKH